MKKKKEGKIEEDEEEEGNRTEIYLLIFLFTCASLHFKDKAPIIIVFVTNNHSQQNKTNGMPCFFNFKS